MKDKVCPLTLVLWPKEKTLDCLKDECGWYHGSEAVCAIRNISDRLSNLNELIYNK